MNTQEQTTPGPWRYVENRNTPRVESEATGQRICNFFGAGGLYASYRANAALIVAAPAMLRALDKALLLLPEHPHAKGRGCAEDCEAAATVRTALAQARPSVAGQIPEQRNG